MVCGSHVDAKKQSDRSVERVTNEEDAKERENETKKTGGKKRGRDTLKLLPVLLLMAALLSDVRRARRAVAVASKRQAVLEHEVPKCPQCIHHVSMIACSIGQPVDRQDAVVR